MTVTASALRELHRIHRQLTDLRDRLARGPRQMQACEANVKKNESDLDQMRAAARKARVAVDDKQLQLRAREDRIQDLQGKLNSASSNREYQALKEQIGADEQANSVLEDEILEALEKMDELNAGIKQAEQRLEKARAELIKVQERVEQEQGKLQSELERVQAELKQAEKVLPGEFKADYDRVAKVRGEEALAQVEGEVCGSCHQTITSQMMNLLYLSRPVFCKSCGALLYLPEDRAPHSGE